MKTFKELVESRKKPKEYYHHRDLYQKHYAASETANGQEAIDHHNKLWRYHKAEMDKHLGKVK